MGDQDNITKGKDIASKDMWLHFALEQKTSIHEPHPPSILARLASG
jgi:hypothetical protein